MTENDRQALELAMKIMGRDRHWAPALQERLEGKRYANPLPDREWIFEPQPWHEVAEFAAYICQTDSMNLSPWETPPCHAHKGSPESEKLLARMEAAGISRWHPEPLRALESAKNAHQPSRPAPLPDRASGASQSRAETKGATTAALTAWLSGRD